MKLTIYPINEDNLTIFLPLTRPTNVVELSDLITLDELEVLMLELTEEYPEDDYVYLLNR